MAANGRIPRSQLGDIPGPNAGLLKPAAAAYSAMARRAKQLGCDMSISDGSVGRCYRSYARQLKAKQVYGSNAATPGTSNHGWGLAVDLESMAQRRMVDRIGRRFGWAKAWSDAQWEFWHLKWRSGVWKGRVPAATPTLKRGQAGPSITKLQKLLRAKNVKGAPKPSGYFNKATENAVKRFQKKKGLKADGIVGDKTWEHLRK
jgi:hypothetical protein